MDYLLLMLVKRFLHLEAFWPRVAAGAFAGALWACLDLFGFIPSRMVGADFDMDSGGRCDGVSGIWRRLSRKGAVLQKKRQVVCGYPSYGNVSGSFLDGERHGRRNL